MEEAELVKERLQAITDKRKLQEEISQKRLKVEEEKLKHQHLKKKALRERWLLDGVGNGREQEEMQKQNQRDQKQTEELEQRIFRLEKEIEELEKEEVQISANEEAILKKLRSVERTAEDIIRSVKVEKTETPEESIEEIYANIPDLPESYVPSRLRMERNKELGENEPNRKALYAMEIKVEKDMKTGESTVLSSIPLPSDDFKGRGVKVYDDGRKSVYAVGSNGNNAHSNGTGDLASVEVEDLLRQASERNSKSPTKYHEPVYASQFYRPTTPQKEGSSGPDLQGTTKVKVNGLSSNPNESLGSLGTELHREKSHNFNSLSSTLPKPYSAPQPAVETLPTQPERMITTPTEETNHTQEKGAPFPNPRKSPQEVGIRNPIYQSSSPALQEDEDIKYNIVQALPRAADTEPVTMIFMGYQQAEDDDEEGKKLITGYDGIIHAELVVIDDEEEEEEDPEKPSYHPVGHHSQVYQPAKPSPLPRKRSEVSLSGSVNHTSPHKNSMSLKEQEESLSYPVRPAHLDSQITGDGTEDPSLTALRIRMAKLGKKVI
ncbi:palmdelphin [Ornithorhynchus anatinus]|uniref:Palmdelphin n=1 Tax=Ornithorhynchus anatinus TaxID=9258 RepID=F6YWJ0_ORNAN|nr:palmdelphin [Ornithorhynchus anatinus]